MKVSINRGSNYSLAKGRDIRREGLEKVLSSKYYNIK